MSKAVNDIKACDLCGYPAATHTMGSSPCARTAIEILREYRCRLGSLEVALEQQVRRANRLDEDASIYRQALRSAMTMEYNNRVDSEGGCWTSIDAACEMWIEEARRHLLGEDNTDE